MTPYYKRNEAHLVQDISLQMGHCPNAQLAVCSPCTSCKARICTFYVKGACNRGQAAVCKVKAIVDEREPKASC